jgi:hypothetical protein
MSSLSSERLAGLTTVKVPSFCSVACYANFLGEIRRFPVGDPGVGRGPRGVDVGSWGEAPDFPS